MGVASLCLWLGDNINLYCIWKNEVHLFPAPVSGTSNIITYLVDKRWCGASREKLNRGRRSGEVVIDWKSRDVSKNQPRTQHEGEVEARAFEEQRARYGYCSRLIIES
jgi:hypothetical protein